MRAAARQQWKVPFRVTRRTRSHSSSPKLADRADVLPDAGAVGEDVDAAVPRAHFGEEGVDRGAVGDVEPGAAGGQARGAQPLGFCFRLVDLQVGEDRVGSVAGESLACCQAQALGGAGDDGDLAAERGLRGWLAHFDLPARG